MLYHRGPTTRNQSPMAEFARLPHRMPPQPADSGFGGLACRIEGEAAPYLAVALEPGQEIAFDPQALLWREPSVMLGRTPGSHVVMARGPGSIGFARALGGMMFPIPLPPAAVVQIAQGQVLLTHGVAQAQERSTGLGDRLSGNAGFAIDRFTAADTGGVVWVQARGDVFERGLIEGEMFDIRPEAFLCKDSAVVMESLYPLQGSGSGFELSCLRFTGPGRVAFQTMPRAEESGGTVQAEPSQRTGGLRAALLGRKAG